METLLGLLGSGLDYSDAVWLPKLFYPAPTISSHGFLEKELQNPCLTTKESGLCATLFFCDT